MSMQAYLPTDRTQTLQLRPQETKTWRVHAPDLKVDPVGTYCLKDPSKR